MSIRALHFEGSEAAPILTPKKSLKSQYKGVRDTQFLLPYKCEKIVPYIIHIIYYVNQKNLLYISPPL